jgi:four helix bundle protein
MKKEIENRLVNLSADVSRLTDNLNDTLMAESLGEKIGISSINAALLFSSVQNSDTVDEFIHSNSEVLEELRETHIGLRILYQADTANDKEEMKRLLEECNHLVAIFQKTINTLRKKKENGVKKA